MQAAAPETAAEATIQAIQALPEGAVEDIARGAPQTVQSSVKVAEAIEKQFIRDASPDTHVALWRLMDKLVKGSEAYIAAFQPRLMSCATHTAVKPSSPLWPGFEQLLGSLRFYFPSYLVEAVHGHFRRSAASGERTSSALVLHKQQVRAVGGFGVQRGYAARTSQELQVKTRDSLMAVRVGSVLAPATPEEIVLPRQMPDADAPAGFMQAPQANHLEEYIEARRKRLRNTISASRAAPAPPPQGGSTDTFNDIVMPSELPRDEYGVLIGNFPLGVRFIRDGIRNSGGALELETIVQRISTMADKEVVNEFGEVRQFINIHRPTFTVLQEHGKWIVRLVEDHPERGVPYDAKLDVYTWEQIECPGCSRLLPGRNLQKHRNSRRCIGMQLSNGTKGSMRTPVAELACAAKVVQERLRSAEDDDAIDDDDLFWLADVIGRAGSERRFKLAAPHHFAPILSAIRTVRDTWLRLRKVTEMSELRVEWQDRAFVAVFAALGANMRRLPVPWIETGDVIDMCRRFTSGVLPPFPPPPKAGDPRIRPSNEYPGLLFADSESDGNGDERVSGDDEAFSDDEAEGFVFAPPVTLTETLMVAGRYRDTKKLNYRLKTAPPMQLSRVLEAGGTKTVQQAYGDQIGGAQSNVPAVPAAAPSGSHAPGLAIHF